MQWSPQELGEARDMECLRKAESDDDHREPEREALRTATTSSIRGARPPEQPVVQTSPHLSFGAGHRNTGFQICLVGSVP